MATVEKRGQRWRVKVRRAGRKASKTFATESAARRWADAFEQSARTGSEQTGRLLALLPPAIQAAHAAAAYSHSEIVLGAVPAVRSPGVYFLVEQGKVMYVGQTTNLYNRLRKHVCDGMTFDAYNFIPCDNADLGRLETAYIAALLPPRNRAVSLA